jgi:2-polyprenyl-6-methoxyphenol hydroxylase-like FAD-dependent oxidoreductase
MYTSSPSVLIVGAGPTGLIVGTELLRRGLPVRIIDKLPSPIASSRAFTVHSRSLEAMDVLGLTAELKEHSGGVHATSMMYHFVTGDDKKIVKTLNLSFDNTVVRGRHPGILTVPQTVTERVLRLGFERAGGKIEWNTELTSLRETEDGVQVQMLHNSAGDSTASATSEEAVVVNFLVGADGARSTIRKEQNLEFSGLAYSGMTMKLMDVSLNHTLDTSTLQENAYHYLINKKSMLLLAKMGDVEDYKGDTDVWRVLLSTQV